MQLVSFKILLFYCIEFKILMKETHADAFLDATEKEMTASLFEHFQLKHCIFIGSKDVAEKAAVDVKTFSSLGIVSTFQTYQQLIHYINFERLPNFGTLVVMREPDLFKVVELFENFQKLSISYKTSLFSWLVFSNQLESTNVIVNRIPVPYNCEFIIAQPLNGKIYRLTEVYQIKNNYFAFNYGTWNRTLTTSRLSFYERRMDFNRTVLDISYFSYMRGYGERGAIHYEILDGLIRVINCRYRAVPDDLLLDPTVQDMKGDIYMDPFPFHADVYTNDIVGPMYETVVNWYIRYPEKGESSEVYYLQPFDLNLWAAVGCFIIIGGLIFLLRKVLWDLLTSSTATLSLVDSVFMGIEAVCNQSGSCDLNSISFRLICISLRLTALFIIPAYSATIISFLAVQRLQVPFTNLNEFAQNAQWMLSYPYMSFTYVYLNSSRDPLLSLIFNNFSVIQTNRHYESRWSVRFCYEKLAYAEFDNDFYSLDDIHCKPLEIQHPIAFPLSGAPLRRNSPFKKILNYILMRFYTSGLREKFHFRLRKHPLDDSDDDLSLKPVGMSQTFQLLIVLLIGIVISLVNFVCEIIVYEIKIVKPIWEIKF